MRTHTLLATIAAVIAAVVLCACGHSSSLDTTLDYGAFSVGSRQAWDVTCSQEDEAAWRSGEAHDLLLQWDDDLGHFTFIASRPTENPLYDDVRGFEDYMAEQLADPASYASSTYTSFEKVDVVRYPGQGLEYGVYRVAYRGEEGYVRYTAHYFVDDYFFSLTVKAPSNGPAATSSYEEQFVELALEVGESIQVKGD